MTTRPLAAAVLLVFTAALRAQQPAPVELKEPDVFNHHIGTPQPIHLTKLEYEEGRKRRFATDEYFDFQATISADGLVESVKLVKGPALHVEEATAILQARRYKPWIVDGVPVRVLVHDYVSVYPPERRGPAVAFPAQVDRRTLAMTLERTNCYGTCPAYTVTVLGNGSVQWNGGPGAPVSGHHTSTVSSTTVTDLLDRFRQADFLSALPEYHSNWTDHPTFTVTLSYDGQTAKVEDYDGLRDGLPVAIRDLESTIDELSGDDRWLHPGTSLAPTLTAEHWDFAAATPDNLALYKASIARKDTDTLRLYAAAKAPALLGTRTLQPGDSPVICAATSAGDTDLVRQMLEAAKHLPAGVADDCLVAAAGAGNLTMIDLWLTRGANAASPAVRYDDAGHPARPSALEAAIFTGDPAVIQRLLDAHASPRGMTSRNQPYLTAAVQWAGRKRHADEIITMLARAGADPNLRGQNGKTPLAECQFSPELIKPLLDAGATIDPRDDNGNTPLLGEAFIGEFVKELLANGADPAATNKRGETPLSQARQYRCAECIEMIQQAIDQREGRTHSAAPAPVLQ